MKNALVIVIWTAAVASAVALFRALGSGWSPSFVYAFGIVAGLTALYGRRRDLHDHPRELLSGAFKVLVEAILPVFVVLGIAQLAPAVWRLPVILAGAGLLVAWGAVLGRDGDAADEETSPAA